MYVCMYLYIYIERERDTYRYILHIMHVCMYVCMYVCIYIHIDTHICSRRDPRPAVSEMCANMHIYIYICTWCSIMFNCCCCCCCCCFLVYFCYHLHACRNIVYSHLSICARHPCAGAALIFSVSFQLH